MHLTVVKLEMIPQLTQCKVFHRLVRVLNSLYASYHYKMWQHVSRPFLLEWDGRKA